MIPVFAACSDSEPTTPEVPQTPAPQQNAAHGPFFPQCGGVSDQTIGELTRVTGLVNTANNSVGCQWLAGGGILGPHFSFTWYRGSPIGRERKTEELSRASVEDINIEGHDGFIAVGEIRVSATKRPSPTCARSASSSRTTSSNGRSASPRSRSRILVTSPRS